MALNTEYTYRCSKFEKIELTNGHHKERSNHQKTTQTGISHRNPKEPRNATIENELVNHQHGRAGVEEAANNGEKYALLRRVQVCY